MATAAETSASEPEAESKAGPKADGEEDEVKAARTRRKVLSRAVAAATYKTMGPGWDQQEEGVSESDGDEYAMASSAESSPGEYEWEYDEEEEKNQLEIERLEEQLSINVYDYNCHVDLIRLLRLEGELTKVRMARQKMSEIFPLTEELWLEWLHDEISMGLAYVEYENESQASQAVMKMDGMTIKENIIKVAISNPPQRKEGTRWPHAFAADIRSEGEGKDAAVSTASCPAAPKCCSSSGRERPCRGSCSCCPSSHRGTQDVQCRFCQAVSEKVNGTLGDRKCLTSLWPGGPPTTQQCTGDGQAWCAACLQPQMAPWL
uniref:Spliceosome associated factor 3, U4/U6 recycling protein n=1 Tax=Gorilla gorilla gorilla TaxID=9595 RepID=A0A2I2Y2P4_GORGO